MYRFLRYTIVFIISIIVSCTSVDFKHEVEHENTIPTSVRVNVDYDWNTLNASPIYKKPDSLYIALSRVVNEKHYLYSTDTSGSILTNYRLEYDENGNLIEEIESGSYYVLGFSFDDNRVDPFGLEKFYSDDKFSLQSVSMNLLHLSPDDIYSLYSEDLKTDFNLGIEYINEIFPIYYDAFQVSLPSLEYNDTLKIKPVPLTQKIVFKFPIALQVDKINIEGKDSVRKSVEIVDAFGTLSGISDGIQLLTRQINDSTKYRTVFEFDTLSEHSGEVMLGDTTYYNYVLSGDIDVLGLFPPESEESVMGDGMLNLTIIVSAYNEVSHNYKKHTFFLTVNLYDFINANEFIEPLSDGSGHRLIVKDTPVVFDWQGVMYFSKDFVLKCANAPGAELWIHDEDDNFDIEL